MGAVKCCKYEWPVTFSSERRKDDHGQGRLDPQWGFKEKIPDNFPIFKISKLDIGLIKMLFCSVAKVEPLVLKLKILSRCIDCLVKTLSNNLDCAFRKSYAVTTWTPITAYKLVEYLVGLLFKNNNIVINVLFMFFKNGISLCLQFICCVFCSDLKSENMRVLCIKRT